MKAVIIDKYGLADKLKLIDAQMPLVKPDGVLIRNYYTTVNPMDYKARNGELKMFLGRNFPKILGVESAGIIDQVGAKVTAFKKGDRVMSLTAFKFGTYAEYTACPANIVFKLPDNVTFEQGATLGMAGGTAYTGIYLTGKIKKGDEVLINGAYGGIGSFAVQLAKLAGAKVTAVCSSENIENVKLLGADNVIDYTKQDICTNGKQYDIVFDTVAKLDVGKVKGILNKGGMMITTAPSFSVVVAMLLNIFSAKKVKSVWNSPKKEDMSFLASLVAEKKLTVIIDREYKLDEMAEAHKYSETGKAKGKILIRI